MGAAAARNCAQHVLNLLPEQFSNAAGNDVERPARRASNVTGIRRLFSRSSKPTGLGKEQTLLFDLLVKLAQELAESELDLKSSGVTGAGKNVRAPEYVRKAARSAFDYDGPGLMPKNHFDAYMGGINIDVDEIQVAIHLMLAGVDVGEEAIHPDGYRTVQQPRLGPESTTVACGHPLASFLCKNCPLSVAFACCDDDWSWVTSTVP